MCSANRMVVPSLREGREGLVNSGEKYIVECVEVNFIQGVKHISVFHEVKELVVQEGHTVVHISP